METCHFDSLIKNKSKFKSKEIQNIKTLLVVKDSKINIFYGENRFQIEEYHTYGQDLCSDPPPHSDQLLNVEFPQYENHSLFGYPMYEKRPNKVKGVNSCMSGKGRSQN